MLPMKRWSFLAVFMLGVCSFTFLAAISCIAQTAPNLEQVFKPYGSYQGGDIDSVGLTNGNVMLHGRLASYSQRGGKLRLNFIFSYNNKGWVIKKLTSPPAQVWSYSGGQLAIGPDQPMGFTHQIVRQPNQSGDTDLIHIYHAITADGSAHQLAPTSGLAQGPLDSYIGESIDATGIRLEGATKTLIDRDGIRYTGVLNNAIPSTWTDPNGNQISVNTNGWTDTLGRLIPGSVPSDATYGTYNQGGLVVG